MIIKSVSTDLKQSWTIFYNLHSSSAHWKSSFSYNDIHE